MAILAPDYPLHNATRRQIWRIHYELVTGTRPTREPYIVRPCRTCGRPVWLTAEQLRDGAVAVCDQECYLDFRVGGDDL